MSRAKRPTVPEFDVRGAIPASQPRPEPPAMPDAEPPSGIMLRNHALAGVPRLAVSTAALKEMRLDHRAGFIVSFIDGTFTIEMILDACAMRREDALAILRELVDRRIVAVE